MKNDERYPANESESFRVVWSVKNFCRDFVFQNLFTGDYSNWDTNTIQITNSHLLSTLNNRTDQLLLEKSPNALKFYYYKIYKISGTLFSQSKPQS